MLIEAIILALRIVRIPVAKLAAFLEPYAIIALKRRGYIVRHCSIESGGGLMVVGRGHAEEEGVTSPNNGIPVTNKGLNACCGNDATKASNYVSNLYTSIVNVVGLGKSNALWLPYNIRNDHMNNNYCRKKQTLYEEIKKSVKKTTSQVNCAAFVRDKCDSPLMALADLILPVSRFENRTTVSGDHSSRFVTKTKFAIAKDLKKFDPLFSFSAKALF